MREIKFRAWDKKEKTMILFGSAETSSTSGFWGDGVDNYKIQFEREGETNGYNHDDFNESAAVDLMQYTGLKDKNGVEIYEGDRVRFTVEGDSANLKQTGVIEWCDSCCHGFRLQWDHFGNNERISNHELEVIGNIYENPELITK